MNYRLFLKDNNSTGVTYSICTIEYGIEVALVHCKYADGSKGLVYANVMRDDYIVFSCTPESVDYLMTRKVNYSE